MLDPVNGPGPSSTVKTVPHSIRNIPQEAFVTQQNLNNGSGETVQHFDIGSQQTRSDRSSPYPTLDRSTARSGTRAVTPDARSAVSISLTPDREAAEAERIDAIVKEKMKIREREIKETWGLHCSRESWACNLAHA